MKRYLTKAIGLVLAILLAVSVVMPSYVRAEDNRLPICEVFEATWGLEFAANYLSSVALAEYFYDSLPQDRLGRIMYPANFGGIFINDDGMLVMLVVGESLGSSEESFVRSFSDAGVLVKEVSFAYNDLHEAFDYLGYLMQNYADNPAIYNIDGVSLSVINNQISIHLAVYTQEKVDYFRSMVFCAPFVMFYQSYGRPEPYAEQICQLGEHEAFNHHYVSAEQDALSYVHIRAGSPLYRRNANGTFTRIGSSGYRALLNQQQVGFVTAAHVTSYIGQQIFDEQRRHIGTVRVVASFMADAAFVSVEPGVGVSNIVGPLGQMREIAPRHASNMAGRRIYADGATSGRSRPGVIIESWQGSFAGVFIRGLRANYASASTDSGGIIYTWVNAWDNGINGTHVGRWFYVWPDGGNALFTNTGEHIIQFDNQLHRLDLH